MFIAASGAKMAYSTDGRSWMAINFPFSSSNNIKGIAYNNNIWVAVGGNGKIAYSLDGMNWTTVDATEAFGTEQVSCVAYGNNRWVAAGNRGKIAYSADGTSWTPPQTADSTQPMAMISQASPLPMAGLS